ncbi:Rubrerythrin [Geosporobacter subterraneus DSM 17957]|uniref:Rubrerythrin n=1 Tax=Geosporobacter subterraneus DSM 17957 TaxID=1121919 RepID=A0A1M6F3J5_9FIRM|nr:ferritin family protein [Geosporobacter subterraneus]SHI92252.1 Rubrerythrin [Geosporobacter subterraneus DSM 17957]
MAIQFDGSKLLQIIIRNEAKVAEFYSNLAAQMEEGKGKKLFESLAQDELKHERIYTGLLNRLPNEGRLELTEDDAAYIELLIETDMFSQSEDVLAKMQGKYAKEDALHVAEKIERDAILYINELKLLFPDLAPEEINIVLAEEKKHLRMVLSKEADASVKLLGL